MRITKRQLQKNPSIEFSHNTDKTTFESRPQHLSTTTVYLLRPPSSAATTTTPWIIADMNDRHPLKFRHPITLKPQFSNLPKPFSLSKFHPATLSVSYHLSSSFDKLLVVPPSPDSLPDCAFLALYDGGLLRGCAPRAEVWVELSRGGNDRFDDIIVFKGVIYSLDREGKLNLINNYKECREISIGKTLITRPITPALPRIGWRKRLVVDGNVMYLVVRKEEELFEIYKLIKRGKVYDWEEFKTFDGNQVLFMAKDYYFFRQTSKKRFPGRGFKDCIVFTEGAFPQYGKGRWEVIKYGKSELDIAIYRLSDGTFGRQGSVRGCSTNGDFPQINWSPSSWVFNACKESAAEFQPRPSSESDSQSESETDDDEDLDSNSGEVQSDSKDSNSEDENNGDVQSYVNIESDSDSQAEVGKMQCVSNSQEKKMKDRELQPCVIIESDSDSQAEKYGKMQCDTNNQKKGGAKLQTYVNIESDSDSQAEKDGKMQCDTYNQEKGDAKVQTYVNIESDSDSQAEDGKMQCNAYIQEKEDPKVQPCANSESDSDSQAEEDGKMQCDMNSQKKEDRELYSNLKTEGDESLQEDKEIHSDTNMEDGASLREVVSPSLFGPESEITETLMVSLSACEEEVTRSLLAMKGRNDTSPQGTPRKIITQSIPRACTSTTTMSHKSDSSTTKFEGFDVRSDLVPTLQKIWMKHGNILESSTIRNGDIIARALESLATMVKMLEDNSAQSLSDSQADYLRSTLSDLQCIDFKVHWLTPFVEKAVKLQKYKPLLNSVNNLSQLSSQVKEHKAIIFNELDKLCEEENKLKEEMAKVSEMILLYGKVKFDQPLGSGITRVCG